MEHWSLLLNALWVVKCGALGAGEREGMRKTNKPEMDGISTVPIYILFLSRSSPLINVYHFIGSTDGTGKAGDLMDVRIRDTKEGL